MSPSPLTPPPPPPQVWPSYARGPHRPVGVTLLALMFLWIGVGGTLFLIVLLASSHLTKTSGFLLHNLIASKPLLGAVALVIFIVTLAIYILYAFIGWGLWKLRNWARKAVIWISLLSLPFSLAMYFAFPRQIRPPLLFFLAIAVPYLLLAWYLNRPRVRFVFGARDGMQLGSDGLPPKLSRKGTAAVMLALAACVALAFVALWRSIEIMFQNSEVYKMAISDANSSPCIGTAIGLPIRKTGTINGNLEESGVSGSAHFQFDVRGQTGEGNLIVDGKKTDGVWAIQRLSLYQGETETKLIPAPSTPCQ